MTGTTLNKAIVELLNLHGHHVWRQNTGAHVVTVQCGDIKKPRFIRYGFKGCSDVIGFSKNGLFIAIEGKVGKDKVTPEQQVFLSAVWAARGISLVVRDNTLGLVEAVEKMDQRSREGVG